MKDYEQLYYDELYENKKLSDKIEELENQIEYLNMCKSDKDVKLQEYIIMQIKRYGGRR